MHKLVDHSVQTIMSRTGSFPVRVALDLLKQHGNKDSVILDPFCGKGTTLLAARLLGYSAYGLDVAPEAVVCTYAKLADVTLDSVHSYIKSLCLSTSLIEQVPSNVRIFFNDDTLAQILSLRDKLMEDIGSGVFSRSESAYFTLASLLGILHGHASYSLSIPSAHAYSMAPAYVQRYAAKHGLKAPLRDVKQCLTEKVARCLSIPLPRPVQSCVKRGSALSCSSLFPDLVGEVDVVLTSPPYLNAQTYAKDNWLRMWLLGYNYKELRNEYINTNSIRTYQDSMMEVFLELRKMLKHGGRLICIAGDVHVRKNRGIYNDNGLFKTGSLLAELCASEQAGLQIEESHEHTVPSGFRYLHALSHSNGHCNRDLVERIFIAKKP